MNYYLVLEKRPGDFMPINISLLENANGLYESLQAIDAFTKKYNEEEIIESIKKSNIVPDSYLEGKLFVINNHKYRSRVLTKDIDLSLDTFFEKYIGDKQVMNKFMNIYLKYSKEDVETIKNAISEKRIDIILQTLFLREYEVVRNIYIYLYENIK